MSENLDYEKENNATETPMATAESTAAETTAGATDTAKVQPAETEGVTSAVVKIEGQEFSLPTSIADNDELLKAALSPHYPSIKNAQISRETRAGQMIVSIVKRAEHKGNRSSER